MRFLSKHSRYRHIIRHQTVDVLATGMPVVRAEGFTAEFEHGGLTEWDRDVARRTFFWKGLPTAQDGAPLDPVTDLYRVSVFDTAEIANPELREETERVLLASSDYGRDLIVVEKPALVAPWPSYDKMTDAKAIAEAVITFGAVRDDVIAFERENANRKDVLAALQKVPDPEAEPDALVAA